jgi:hypothetical protein
MYYVPRVRKGRGFGGWNRGRVAILQTLDFPHTGAIIGPQRFAIFYFHLHPIAHSKLSVKY